MIGLVEPGNKPSTNHGGHDPSSAPCAPASSEPFDTGLLCLGLVASFYRIGADATRMRHELALGANVAASGDIITAAIQLGLKARSTHRRVPAQIANVPMPAMVGLKDGTWGVIIRPTSADRYLLIQPEKSGPPKTQELASDALAEKLSGEVVLIARRIGGAGISPQAFNFSWFIPTLRRYRRPLSNILMGSLFVQILALATPLFFQLVVDKVLVHNSISTLTMVVSGLIVLNIFDCLLQYLRTYILGHTASRIDVELGARLFDRLTRLPMSYFETRAAGQIVARVRELETIRGFLTGQGLSSILDLVFSVVFISVLFLYSPKLTLIVLLSFPFYIAITLLVRPVLRKRVDERFQTGSACQQLLVESVIGVQTLKAAAVEPQLRSQWEERLAAYVRTSFGVVSLAGAGQSSIQLVNKTTIALVLFAGAQAVMRGELTVGGLIAFNMLMSHATQPILRLSQLWQDFQQIQISVERLSDILNHPAESQPTAAQPNLPPMRGSIEFRGVTFRYSSDRPDVLKGVDLTVPAGQMIGIIGPSGSGKSTLTKLLQRFYRPDKGSVLIDGIDTAHTNLDWLRRQIGVVQQEDILFNRTIHDNIALTNPAMARGQVIEAAHMAGADEFIAKLPMGYDTIIEERGANLSGGQRQRLAIARALVSGPRILILDEATSALDYESERIIRANLRRIAQGRTVIIIAHRLAAVQDCERIIAMQDGRVVEDGNPDKLLASSSSVYGKLWQIQSARKAG